MPLAQDVKEEGKSLKARLLLYGPPKTKKSWWILASGAFGFNHLYIDFENSRHIIKNIASASLQRTLILDVQDTTGNACGAKFITKFLRGGEILWDEQAKMEVPMGGKLDPTHSHVLLNATKLTENDLVSLDSYTAVVQSVREQDAKALGVDIADGASAVAAKDSGDMREVYHADGIGLDSLLNRFGVLPCHIAMIGHASNYEQHDPKDQKKILQVRRQLKSSSGPHAMTIANRFSDILHFELQGTAYKISTEAHQSRDGGCRVIKPGLYDWEKLQFVDYCTESNIQKPPADLPPSEGFIYFPPGETPTKWQKKEQVSLPAKPPGGVASIQTGVKPGLITKPQPSPFPNLLKKEAENGSDVDGA